MSSTNTVAVVGTTGKLGREAVIKLSQRGIPTRCLVRFDPPSPSATLDPNSEGRGVAAYLSSLPNVELVKGDLSDKESLRILLKGCTACLALFGARRMSKWSDALPWTNPETDPTHAKNVNYEGVRNLIQAARECQSCRRIVRITGKGEEPFSVFSILINLFGSMAKAWNYEGEELLRNCPDVDYTIIRPGVMKAEPPVEGANVLALADNGGDLKVSPVPYATIAELCVNCLEYPNAARSTLTAMNVPEGEGEASYEPLLATVKPDTREFPSSLMDENRRAVRVGASVIVALFAVFVTGAASLIQAVLSRLTN